MIRSWRIPYNTRGPRIPAAQRNTPAIEPRLNRSVSSSRGTFSSWPEVDAVGEDLSPCSPWARSLGRLRSAPGSDTIASGAMAVPRRAHLDCWCDRHPKVVVFFQSVTGSRGAGGGTTLEAAQIAGGGAVGKEMNYSELLFLSRPFCPHYPWTSRAATWSSAIAAGSPTASPSPTASWALGSGAAKKADLALT